MLVTHPLALSLSLVSVFCLGSPKNPIQHSQRFSWRNCCLVLTSSLLINSPHGTVYGCFRSHTIKMEFVCTSLLRAACVAAVSAMLFVGVCVCVWVLAKVLIVYHSSVFVQTSPETRMQSVHHSITRRSFFFIHSIYIIYFLLLLLLSFAFLLLIWPYSTWHKFATCGLVDRFSGSSSS